MSNQKTPNSKRHRRRRDEAPSRNMFVEVYEETEKKNKKFVDIFNKSQKVNEEAEIETPKMDRRDSRKKSNEPKKAEFKPLNIFQSHNRGDDEKRIRRNKRNVKTLIFFGGSLVLFIAAVVVSIILFTGGKEENPDLEQEAVSNEVEITQNKVMIYYNDDVIEAYTDMDTVGEVLAENQIELDDGQDTNFDEDDKIHDNMEIFIDSPMTVSVVHNDIKNSVTVYGGRVADVFIKMDIELDDYDIVNPSAETLVEDGMNIEFTNVEIKEVSVFEDLPYETEEGETNTVEAGYYHEEQEGIKGSVKITYEVKYIDDVEQSREEISREVVEEPTNRVILWGTAARSTSSNSSSDSSDNGDSGDSSDSGDNDDSGDSSYDDIVVNNPGEQATNPSVPAAPSDYMEIMSGHVTAYTHTGNTTATGTWPRSTRTLDNPGSCAVVPSTIPYGSLLYVTGYGYCIAEDTGAFRTDPDRWNQIDLFMNTRDECITWGRRRDVKVYILRKGY